MGSLGGEFRLMTGRWNSEWVGILFAIGPLCVRMLEVVQLPSSLVRTLLARTSLAVQSMSMEIDHNDVLALLLSGALADVESAIADRTQNTICRDYLKTTARLTQAEISLSGLSVDEISSILRDQHDSVIEFGIRFLQDEAATEDTQEYPEGEEPDPEDVDRVVANQGLGVGFGVTYAIYWHFLTNQAAKDFTEFLQKRRIPGARKFTTDLRRIHDAMAD